jgi:hypothetical protein
MDLIHTANNNSEIGPDLVKKIQTVTDLIPPDLQTERSYSYLYNKIKVHPSYPPEPMLSATENEFYPNLLDGTFTDEQAIKCYPPRSKRDLSIRRTHLRTVYNLYSKTDSLPQWRLLLNACRHLDYIFLMNVLWAWQLHGDDLINMLLHSNSLVCIEYFGISAKWLNDQVKKYPCPKLTRKMFAEVGALTGYRNPPFPGFNQVEDARDLAQSGAKHGLDTEESVWLQKFRTAATAITSAARVEPVTYMTLREFVTNGDWATSGASSEGYLHWDYLGQHGKVKCRKNLVRLALTDDQIYSIAIASLYLQMNSTVVKPELGKIRIAVAGDLGTYLTMSWLNYLCHSVYKHWPHSTLEETMPEQIDRTNAMLNSLIQAYGLPFDFKGFDHQAALAEIKILCDIFFRLGSVNVPYAPVLQTDLPDIKDDALLQVIDQKTFHEYIYQHVISAFDNSFLTVRDEHQREVKFKITGGLESGLRITSLIGNFWNMTITKMAMDNLKELGLSVPFSDYLRGDDSSISSIRYAAVLLMRLSYASMNAVGVDGKFGIHYQETEFLRQWYNQDGLYGYPNRSIPNLTERKPWSSEPWQPENTITDLIDTVYILQRRLSRPLPDLLYVLKGMWSRLRHVSTHLLELPKVLGGLGLLPWNDYIPDRPISITANIPQIKIDIQSGYHERIQRDFIRWNLTTQESETIAQADAADKLGADDLVSLSQFYRDKLTGKFGALTNLKWHKYTGTRSYLITPDLPQRLSVLSTLDSTSKAFNDATSIENLTYYGKHSLVLDWWQKAQQVKLARPKYKPMEAAKLEHPVFYEDQKHLTKLGFTRSAALDILFGKFSLLTKIPIQSQLAPIITANVLRYMFAVLQLNNKLTRFDLATLTSKLPLYFCETLAQSRLNKRIFDF